MYEDQSRMSFAPKRLNYMVQDMARYLHREDVLPILIPSLTPRDLRSFVKNMDGIVIQGGDDIAPETFGEQPIGHWKGDAIRDEIELDIIKYALAFGLPVYGICRGFQLMNVYFGGTLYQDIPTQFETPTLHKSNNYDQNTHRIAVEKNTFLYDINEQQSEALVNSIHHQGVKDLGKGLNIVARGVSDGMVEAFDCEAYEPGKVMGVQWHPEFNWNHNEKLLSAEKLYDHFLQFAKRRS